MQLQGQEDVQKPPWNFEWLLSEFQLSGQSSELLNFCNQSWFDDSWYITLGRSVKQKIFCFVFFNSLWSRSRVVLMQS